MPSGRSGVDEVESSDVRSSYGLAMADEQRSELASSIDFDTPHAARVWNYWMGGRDNYAADRAAGDAVAEVYPDIVTMARQSRRYLVRTVRFLAGQAGIRQFLDIGTGLPTMQNTHEVAQSIAPECRIVYVDNDPLVCSWGFWAMSRTSPRCGPSSTGSWRPSRPAAT
jgi:hypothetical protein